MADLATLEKILHMKQQEKSNAEKQKQHALEKFEKMSLELYEGLQKKEQAELDLSDAMGSEITITKLKNQSLYIHSMTEKILQLQQQVQIARKKMDEKQAILTEAHIEVKKIEKLIETRVDEQRHLVQKQENQVMDDISIRQYVHAN